MAAHGVPVRRHLGQIWQGPAFRLVPTAVTAVVCLTALVMDRPRVQAAESATSNAPAAIASCPAPDLAPCQAAPMLSAVVAPTPGGGAANLPAVSAATPIARATAGAPSELAPHSLIYLPPVDGLPAATADSAQLIPGFVPLPEDQAAGLTTRLASFLAPARGGGGTRVARRMQPSLGSAGPGSASAAAGPVVTTTVPIMPTAPLSGLAVGSFGRPVDALDEWNPRTEIRTSKTQQFGWGEFIIRNGPLMPTGGGLYENLSQTGWAFEAGIRQPFTNPGRRMVWFGELGGGYYHNSGNGTTVVTPGTFTDPSVTPTYQEYLSNFYITEMKSISRTFAYSSLGFYLQPERWHNPGRSQVRITFRGSGRAGSAGARYLETPTAALDNTITTEEMKAGSNSLLYRYHSEASRSSSFLGLGIGTGISLTRYGQCIGPFCYRELTLGAEVQYVHDWFDFGAFGPGERGLGTVATMFNVNWAY